MTQSVLVVNPGDTLARARNLMLSKKIGRLVVLEDDRIVGILTREDLVKAFTPSRSSLKARPIDQLLVMHFMHKPVLSIDSNIDLSEAAKMMLEKNIGGLPVTSKGKLVGIITTHDITRYVSQLSKRGLHVNKYMNKEIAYVSLFHSMNHVTNLLFKNPDHRVIVIDSENKPVGIISPSNLAFTKFSLSRKVASKRSVAKGGGATHIRISYVAMATAGDIMTSPVVIVHENDTVQSAASIMVTKDLGALPVLNGAGHVIGLFSKKEVLDIATKEG